MNTEQADKIEVFECVDMSRKLYAFDLRIPLKFQSHIPEIKKVAEEIVAGRTKTIEEKDQRIKELEDGLRTLRHGLFKDAGAVNEFIDILLNQK